MSFMNIFTHVSFGLCFPAICPSSRIIHVVSSTSCVFQEGLPLGGSQVTLLPGGVFQSMHLPGGLPDGTLQVEAPRRVSSSVPARVQAVPDKSPWGDPESGGCRPDPSSFKGLNDLRLWGTWCLYPLSLFLLPSFLFLFALFFPFVFTLHKMNSLIL